LPETERDVVRAEIRSKIRIKIQIQGAAYQRRCALPAGKANGERKKAEVGRLGRDALALPGRSKGRKRRVAHEKREAHENVCLIADRADDANADQRRVTAAAGEAESHFWPVIARSQRHNPILSSDER
jgi:hypothetical protein